MEGLQSQQASGQAGTTALYFPHISVPQTPWFTQVLLYWDKAAAIVPEGLEYEYDRKEPFMRDLNRAGLLDYIYPGKGLAYRSGGDFDAGFIKLLESGKPPPPEGLRRFTEVHVDKMGHGLFEELHRQGLAEAVDGHDWEWWRIETTTAATYMGYLASAISGARPGMTPVRDRLECLETLRPQSAHVRHKVDHLRLSTITDALPAPGGIVPAAELIDFKSKNAELLHGCRSYLDDKLLDLAKIDDPYETEVRTKATLQAIKREVKSLKDQMERRRWPKITLVGFGGLAVTALDGTPRSYRAGSTLAMGLSFGAAVLAGVAADMER